MISSIGILGYGQFGAFITLLCRTHFPQIEIKIASRGPAATHSFQEVCNGDILFPCGPLGQFDQQMKEISQYVSSNTIVWELCSIKVYPTSILKQYPNVKYISTHPMFGPESYQKHGGSLQGLKIILCEHNINNELFSCITPLLQKFGLDVLFMSAYEHDQKVAYSLFLTHYISQIVYQAGFDRTPIDTVSFGFLMDAVESVRDNTQLFLDVWKHNPYCAEVVEKFRNTQQLLEQYTPSIQSNHERSL